MAGEAEGKVLVAHISRRVDVDYIWGGNAYSPGVVMPLLRRMIKPLPFVICAGAFEVSLWRKERTKDKTVNSRSCFVRDMPIRGRHTR